MIRSSEGQPVEGVVFDLDGVLIDSEHLWEESWTAFCASAGSTWSHADTLRVQGMSSLEWSQVIAGHVGRPGESAGVAEFCTAFTIRRIVADGEGEPLPGARDLVVAISERVPIALASSAARPAIDAVLDHLGLTSRFTATVSSDEVAQGKPSPDVYLEAVRRLGMEPARCLAVEDSTNGIFAAHAAGLAVVAIPNRRYPPRTDATDVADFIADDADGARVLISSLLGERTPQ
jgi:HAD superfamily hydrolase (TIGR01509 family)